MPCTLFRIGKVWHYRFTVDGKRVQRSTRETQHARAERVAEAAYREAALWARHGRVIPTLRELVAQWLKAHEYVVSKSHISGVETFGRLHLYDLGDTLIDDLTTDAVEKARNKHLENHAPITANLWCRTIRKRLVGALQIFVDERISLMPVGTRAEVWRCSKAVVRR